VNRTENWALGGMVPMTKEGQVGVGCLKVSRWTRAWSISRVELGNTVLESKQIPVARVRRSYKYTLMSRRVRSGGGNPVSVEAMGCSIKL
jgi:hypothetical protein